MMLSMYAPTTGLVRKGNLLATVDPNMPQTPIAPQISAPANTTIGNAPQIQQPVQAMPANVPQTGLIGSEQALTTGYNQARSGLMSGYDAAQESLAEYRRELNNREGLQVDDKLNADVTGAIQQGVAAFDPYMQSGSSATKLYDDLTGVNGPDAQAAAQQAYRESPALQYQMDQMQRATERSAAARGGLMGGNVLKELQRNAQGLASQDYFRNLGAIGESANRGLSAAGQVGNLRSNQAGMAANLQGMGLQAKAQFESQREQMRANIAEGLSRLAESRALNVAGLDTGYSTSVATGRQNAGYEIARTAQDASTNMAKYLNDQGIGVNDMMTKDLSSVTDFLYQSGLQDKVDMQNLATLIANINSGQATNISNAYNDIGLAQAGGALGVGNAIAQGTEQYLKYGKKV